jgi:glycosyl transferase family 25
MISLANQSKNLTEYIAQVNRLCSITKDSCSLTSATGPSITVSEEFVKAGNKVPKGIGLQVSINPSVGLQDPLSSKTLEKINTMIYSDDDPVLKGYVKKYFIDDVNTYVIVYDLSLVNIHSRSVAFMLSFVEGLDELSNIVYIVTCSSLNPLRTQIPSPTQEELRTKAKIRVTPILDWELAVKMASLCDNHILMNTTTSTLCAKLKKGPTVDRSVWSPVPLVDGSNPDFGWYGVRMPTNSCRMFDWIYYINMNKRRDRREHMEGQLAKFNFTAARVEAVDGGTLKWEGPKTKFWNSGALGYCLSYQNALIDAIKNNYSRVLIMDDDAVLTDNFLEVLEKAYASLPNNWHMLYLAANHNKQSMPTEKEKISEHLYRLKGSVGSHAIIINRPAFETILNYASSPYGPLDIYFSVYQQICPCFITNPGLATQMAGRSDIINEEVDYSKDWGVDYVNHIAYLKNDVSGGITK